MSNSCPGDSQVSWPGDSKPKLSEGSSQLSEDSSLISTLHVQSSPHCKGDSPFHREPSPPPMPTLLPPATRISSCPTNTTNTAGLQDSIQTPSPSCPSPLRKLSPPTSPCKTSVSPPLQFVALLLSRPQALESQDQSSSSF